jgi:cell division septation protein DedD
MVEPLVEEHRRSVWPNVIAVAVAFLLGIGAWGGYHFWHRSGAPGPVPVLHADAGPVKVPPKKPGGRVIPDTDVQVLNGPSDAEPKVEQLLPPPETPLPLPRPAPPTAPAVEEPKAAAATPPAAAPPEPAPAPAAATPRPAPPATGWRVQVAAVRSPDAAKTEWERVRRANGDVLGSLQFGTQITLDNRGTYYRVLAGPVADEAQAKQICAALIKRKQGCLVVKP